LRQRDVGTEKDSVPKGSDVMHLSLSGAPSLALLPFLTSGRILGRGPTVGSPWSSFTSPSLGRGRVAQTSPLLTIEFTLLN